MGTVLVKGTGIDSKPHLSGIQVQTHQLNEVSLTFHAEDAQGHPVNTGHIDLKSVVDTCQRTNTSIYAFLPPTLESGSSGPRNLAVLTSQTGGRVFDIDESEAE